MKLQIKRSNVLVDSAAKAPVDTQMEYGELAVNYNAADPVLFIKDSDNNVIRLTNREQIPPGLPDITDPNYQAGTLDDRYMSVNERDDFVPKNDWSGFPALS